jgi:hypothetical protein
MLAAMAFVNTDATLAALSIKQRDEDIALTPEDEAPKKLRLILTAEDLGRVIRAGHAPIRAFRLTFAIRGNVKTAAGKADPFAETCGALEALLDGSNLITALDSPANACRVMLATRAPGGGFSVQGAIRIQSYSLEVKAVGSEFVTS